MTREVLEAVASHIKVGVTTEELDAICHEECIKRNSYPSPLASLGSVIDPQNELTSRTTTDSQRACARRSMMSFVTWVAGLFGTWADMQGIPDQYQLKDGDIINIDVSLCEC